MHVCSVYQCDTATINTLSIHQKVCHTKLKRNIRNLQCKAIIIMIDHAKSSAPFMKPNEGCNVFVLFLVILNYSWKEWLSITEFSESTSVFSTDSNCEQLQIIAWYLDLTWRLTFKYFRFDFKRFNKQNVNTKQIVLRVQLCLLKPNWNLVLIYTRTDGEHI